MNFTDFTKSALKTEGVAPAVRSNPELLCAALTLGVLVSEVLDLFKRGTYYNNKPIDAEVLNGKLQEIALVTGIIGVQRAHVNDPEAKVGLNIQWKPDAKKGQTGEPVIFEPHVGMFNMRMLHAAVGTFTEAGEVLKAVVDGSVSGRGTT